MQTPTFSSHKVHGNYVDCVRWFGDLVLSKSVENVVTLFQPRLGGVGDLVTGSGFRKVQDFPCASATSGSCGSRWRPTRRTCAAATPPERCSCGGWAAGDTPHARHVGAQALRQGGATDGDDRGWANGHRGVRRGRGWRWDLVDREPAGSAGGEEGEDEKDDATDEKGRGGRGSDGGKTSSRGEGDTTRYFTERKR